MMYRSVCLLVTVALGGLCAEAAPDYASLKKEADHLYYHGQYDEAQDTYLKAKALNDRDPELYVRLGDIASKRARFDEAVAWFIEATRLDPDNLEGILGLGTVHLTQQRFAEAAAEFKRALQLQPDNVTALEFLGGIYYRTGQLEDALKTLESLKDLTPKSYLIRVELGHMYAATGDYEKAVGEYQAAVAIAPTYASAYEGLASLAVRMGKADEAIRYYRQGADLAPKDLFLKYNWANAYALDSKYREALDVLFEIQADNPDFSALDESIDNLQRFLSKDTWRLGLTCYPNAPKPELTLAGTEEQPAVGTSPTRKSYHFELANWRSFPVELFAEAPQLPPCGRNTSAGRTWTYLNDAHGKPLKVSCGGIAASDYAGIPMWLSVNQRENPPDSVFLTLWDRGCSIHYVSNWVNLKPAAELR